MTTGAKLLVQCLEAGGVRHVFGLPGTQTLAVWDEVRAGGALTPVFLRNEQDLSLAAKGYFQSGGGLSAVVTVPGPGATNMVTGVLDALSDSCGMVLVTTDVPPEHLGKGCVHDCDLAAIFRPIVKAQLRVGQASHLASQVLAAIDLARSGRPGPVQVIVSGQLLRAEHDVDLPDLAGVPTEPARSASASADEVAAAAAALGAAERPLVYAGGGAAVSGATGELAALARRLGAPVVTSLSGRGVIPEDDPLVVGAPFFPGVAELIGLADAALVVGTRFSEISTATWSFDLPDVVVRIDVDREALHCNYPSSHPLEGDARTLVGRLLDELEHRQTSAWDEPLKELRRAQEAAIVTKLAAERRPGGRVHPMVLTEALRAALPRGTLVTMDGSATEFWLMHPTFPVYEPLRFLLSEVSQELGAALPVAIGAAAALDGAPVVCVSGDGGLMYNAPELSAVVQQGLAVKVVVFDDGGWYNSVRQFQDAFFGGRYIGTELVNPDWAQLAGSMSVPCEVVSSEADLLPAFQRMMATPGVAMVVVEIDREPIAPRFEIRIEERRASL